MTEQQLREEMVQIGASLFSRGYATGGTVAKLAMRQPFV
ncbi:TPA: hypothetical protein ACPVEL_005465, partial [Escherichia coli]